MATQIEPARRLGCEWVATRKIRYPNRPTTIDGREDSVSIAIRRNFVKALSFAYSAM